MGVEIERKFLVSGAFPLSEKQYKIKQGYINPDLCTVHISNTYLMLKDKQGACKEILYIGSTDAQSIIGHLDTDISGNITFKDESIVRIRVRGTEWFVTLKGRSCVRGTPEYEYSIPVDRAECLLEELSDGYLSKTRYLVDYEGKTWEVDVFSNLDGLVIAEIELTDINDAIEIPAWVGTEVTGDHQYSNSNLIKKVLERKR